MTHFLVKSVKWTGSRNTAVFQIVKCLKWPKYHYLLRNLGEVKDLDDGDCNEVHLNYGKCIV